MGGDDGWWLSWCYWEIRPIRNLQICWRIAKYWQHQIWRLLSICLMVNFWLTLVVVFNYRYLRPVFTIKPIHQINLLKSLVKLVLANKLISPPVLWLSTSVASIHHPCFLGINRQKVKNPSLTAMNLLLTAMNLWISVYDRLYVAFTIWPFWMIVGWNHYKPHLTTIEVSESLLLTTNYHSVL